MSTATWIGSLAAIISVASFTPQAWKIIKERHSEGLSAFTYALACVGFTLWVSYGVLRGDWAIIVPNSICLLLAAFILLLILLPEQKTEQVARAVDPAPDA